MRLEDSFVIEAKLTAALHILDQIGIAADRRGKIALELINNCRDLAAAYNKAAHSANGDSRQ